MKLFGVTCLLVVIVVINLTNGEPCRPGETKRIDCNDCECLQLEDGAEFACTRKRCPVATPRERRAPDCVPGQTRQVDCNSCRCVRGGGWACTRRACLGPAQPRNKREVPVATDLKNTPCAPNDYFKIDCNTCYCREDRSGYLCTENFCAIYGDPATATATAMLSSTEKMVPSETLGDFNKLPSSATHAAIVSEDGEDTRNTEGSGVTSEPKQ